MTVSTISQPTLRRLPRYLSYLKSLGPDAPEYISATGIAEALGLGQVQVRKDLAQVSSSGRPKVGYVTIQLINEIESFLGYNNVHDAVLVGAGRLGRALMGYDGFKSTVSIYLQRSTQTPTASVRPSPASRYFQ